MAKLPKFLSAKTISIIITLVLFSVLQIYQSKHILNINGASLVLPTYDNRHFSNNTKLKTLEDHMIIKNASIAKQVQQTEQAEQAEQATQTVKKKSSSDKNKKLEYDINDKLWIGRYYDEDKIDPHSKDIHIVISYCAHNITWITDFINGYNISSIHIISKCGQPVENAPAGSTIEVVPNVGRNDHSYAYYINSVLDSKMAESRSDKDNSVVVFIKDNTNHHQGPHEWTTFSDLVTFAASSRGFGCLLVPAKNIFSNNMVRPYSAYHYSSYLHAFTLPEYEYEGFTPDGSNETEFKSNYDNLGHMMTSLNIKTQPIVQVCYGGIFSASVSNIKKTEETMWKKIEKTLSRGDNIEEGHFMERYWGAVLSTPLTTLELGMLLSHADSVFTQGCCFNGALLKMRKNIAFKRQAKYVTTHEMNKAST